MPKSNTASYLGDQFSNITSGFWLDHVVSFSFCLSFHKENKWGKRVSIHKCDTVQKACWKNRHIPEMWILETSPPWSCTGKMFASPLNSHVWGFDRLELSSVSLTPHWGLVVIRFSWKSSHSASVVLSQSQSLLKSHRKHLLLVPRMFSHLCSLKICTSVSHDCELWGVVRTFQSL